MLNTDDSQLKKLYELSLLLSGEPDEIIYKIAKMISSFFDVRTVVITEINDNEIHILCAYMDGEIQTNIGKLPLELTPCAMVKEGKQGRFFEHVAELFPQVDFLKQQKSVFYYGVPAMDSHDKVISTTCLLDDKTHDVNEQSESLLRIFGQRVAMEIERKSSLLKQLNTEEALRSSQAQLYNLTNISPVGIFRSDAQVKCIYVNEQWCEFSGLSIEDALGDGWLQAIHPDDREAVIDEWQKSSARNEIYELECRFLTPQKKLTWVIVRVVPEKNSLGDIIGYIGCVMDITQRKEQEIKNAEYQSKLIGVQSLTHLGFFEQDLSTDDAYWSDEIYRILGLEPQQTAAGFEEIIKFVHHDDIENLRDARNTMLHDTGFYDVDYRIKKTNGAERYLHGKAQLYINEQYPAGKIIGTVQDISERKYIENALNILTDISTVDEINIAYKDIVANLSRVYNASYAFLGVFADSSHAKIMTQAVWVHGKQVENFEYELEGTPCADVLNEEVELISENAAALYPDDIMLSEMGVDSYYGAPLITRNDEKIGLLVVMDTKPMNLGHWTKSILGLFAQQVASLFDRHRIEKEIRESQKTLVSILNNIQDIYYRTNTKGVVTMVSPSLKTVLGYEVDEILGGTLSEFYVETNKREELIQKIENNNGFVEAFEAGIYHKDGHVVWMSANAHYYYDENGKILGVEGVSRDVSKQHAAELQMQKMSSAMQQTADMVLIADKDGIVEYVNPSFENITGYSSSEVIGLKSSALRSGRHNAEFYKELWETIKAGRVFNKIFINKKKDGTLFYEDKTITPLQNVDGEITHFVSTGRDISQRMENEKKLQHIAHHDGLTDLPNRILFLDRIQQTLLHAKRSQNIAAILFIDLDRFKNINDTLGHLIGDKLLIEISKNLKKSIREGDSIARLGGDEFAVLVNNVSNEDDVAAVAQKILNCLDQTIMVDGHPLYITASIGISLYPHDGENDDALLKHADIAMYRAKDLGKNNYQFYSKDMSARATQRHMLENGLRQALKNNEFVLYYQPQVDINTYEIIGFEALIRWQHASLGLIPPNDFIPMLEETGLIVEVGEWITRTACQQLKIWEQAGYTDLTMSVNVSGRQFHAKGFYEETVSLVKQYHLSPERLELEITENVLMDNQQKTIQIIDDLDAYGFRIAIDDFGTGYSSLSYLRRFRIDTLKVDQSFIRDVVDDDDDAAITSAIIAMAHSLKLEIVAEGVENQQQLDFLLEQKCQFVQGYFFSRPLPVDEITELLKVGITKPES